MHDFPHHYHASAEAHSAGDIALDSPGLTSLRTASPAEFDGPGDRWSPETLITGAVGDCFILTFRAVARAARLPWTSIRCEVTGTLDRIDRVTQFTEFEVLAHLTVPDSTNAELARRALEKAEQNCLISNSLKGTVRLRPVVEVEETAVQIFG
jgi:organic hydroperoxide reductase OsmC/OhrA